jgi:ribosomal protein S12 methylthiotransferase accessory factor
MRIFDQNLSLPKSHVAGTHRSCSPGETLRRYSSLMPRLGITRLADVTGLDSIGIPVYMSVRPNARSLSVSQGKGIDHDSAKASALMETIELWHAENLRNPVRFESFQALSRNEAVVDLHELPRYLGRKVDENARMPWIEGYDLLRQERVWLPFDAIDLNYVRDGWGPFLPTSNGLASGNHLLEAIVHGLCESIERDASELWKLSENRTLDTDQVDLETVADPHCRELIARIRAANVLVGAFDATSDAGVPTYHAMVCEPLESGRNLGYFWGMGTHLDPAVALSRAITEAVQVRLVEISGAREDIDTDQFESNRDEDEISVLAELLRRPGPPVSFGRQLSLARSSFEEDIEILLDALRRIGIQRAVVADLSRPECGVPVVRVLVPGLEGPGEGVMPGRRARQLAEQAGAQ